MSKKRANIKQVEPIIIKNVRYKVINGAKARGFSQNGGYIGAYDIDTDEELWKLKVYDVFYDNNTEADKQDIFITSMFISSLRGTIVIKNENGCKYSINIDTKKIRKIYF